MSRFTYPEIFITEKGCLEELKNLKGKKVSRCWRRFHEETGLPGSGSCIPEGKQVWKYS